MPSRSWSARRASGSQPPRCMSSKRALSIASSSAFLPAAAMSPIGIGLSSPSITNMSPRPVSRTSRGARSLKRGSMRSTYVPGASVTCESAEMIGMVIAGSAVLAGWEVPGIDRLLEELLRVVLPELAHVRVRVDDRVLQLAVHALDLADVDVLRRVAVGVHLHRAPRRVGDLHLAQGRHERGAVLHLAADGLHRLVDHAGARVAVLAVEARRTLVGLLVGGAELLVGRRLQRGRVVVRADHADRLVAELGQHVLVAVGAVGDERDLALEPALRVLLGEEHRPPPEPVHEDGIGVLLDLADVGRVVLHVERYPELLDDLAAVVLEGLVEAAHGLPAERVVEADDGHLL